MAVGTGRVEWPVPTLDGVYRTREVELSAAERMYSFVCYGCSSPRNDGSFTSAVYRFRLEDRGVVRSAAYAVLPIGFLFSPNSQHLILSGSVIILTLI